MRTNKMITKGKMCTDPLLDCLSYSVNSVNLENFYTSTGASSVNNRPCSQLNTFTPQQPITSCEDPHPTYLSCCYQFLKWS